VLLLFGRGVPADATDCARYMLAAAKGEYNTRTSCRQRAACANQCWKKWHAAAAGTRV